ncbi:hypothetical protein C3L33_03608, partial [Rhododendron williamsianum]
MPNAAGRCGPMAARSARRRSLTGHAQEDLHPKYGFSPHSPIAKRALLSPSTNSGTASIGENNPLLALCDLEFRKAFLILSYTGRRKLEELMTIDHIMMQLEELMTVDHIMMLKDLPWRDFETKVWDAVGKNFINKEDRIQYLDWDSRKTHLYHCHVHQDGSYAFKVDENGCIVRDEEGEPLIHTDGTGFISEDLALKTPKDFSRAKYIKDGNFERFLDHVNCEEKSPELKGSEAHTRELVRLFRNGLAVKGTLLVNKKDPICCCMVVAHSNPFFLLLRPFIIAALDISLKTSILIDESFRGLFLHVLHFAYCFLDAAALNHGERDDDFTVARMILSGVPLNEPYLQYRLSDLAKDERNALKGGKLPITESFYLIGTTDPTGLLESHQVCVILENGQISGDLLVYRNPGLHFGDIHRLEAVYVKELAEIVGNAKYAIFFSTKGERSIANEIANGDFDGDTYWISRNPELLESFKVSEPWRRIYSTPSVRSKMPNELSGRS